MSIIIALLLRLVFFPGDTGASTATFYPEACLGGWQEASQAAGQPDFDDPTPASYSESNAAWLPSGSSAELFCGNFVGVIPDNGLPRGVSVQLNWVFRYDEGPSIETDILDTEVPIVISIDETASGTEADMASSTETDSVVGVLEAEPEAEPVVETSSSTPETLEEESIEEQAEIEPISFIQRVWQRLIPVARAQEATTTDPIPDEAPAEESATTEPEPTSAEEETSEEVPEPAVLVPTSTSTEVESVPDSDPEPVEEEAGEPPVPTVASTTEATEAEEEVTPEPTPEADEVASTTDSETASTTASTTEEALDEMATTEPIESTPDVFLEIFYTMDGEEFPLGFASLEDATGKTLILPDSVIDDWAQVADLQIGIRTIPVLAETPTVYLESVALSVEYEEFESVELEDQPTPTDVIDLGEVEFIETKKPAFSAGENPVFEIDTNRFEAEADSARARYEEERAQQRAQKDKEAAAQVEAALEVLDATSWFPGTASSTLSTSEATPEDTGTAAEEEAPPAAEPPEPEPADEDAAASTTAGIFYGPLPDNQELSFFERIFESLRIPTAAAATTRARVYDVKIKNPEGKPTDLRPVVEETNTGLRVVLPKQPGSFVPGKYQVEMVLEQDGVLYRAQTAFVWGVLAINTDQDIYRPGESVSLQAAVLTDTGHTVCAATIAIRVEDPTGAISTLSTQNGLVRQSGECGANNVTDVPDYQATYINTSRVGVYQVEIENLDNGYEVATSFRVAEAPVAIVSRTGATRINPIAAYVVRAEVQIFDRFSGRVVEQVPAEFEIVSHNANKIATRDGVTYLEWTLTNALPGDRVMMEYTYQAPLVSPYFYELGPVVLYPKGLGKSALVTESRTWQIASDAVGDGDIAIYQDTNGTHDINNTSWTGVPFNSQQRQDSTFTQDANDIDVDLATAGHYLVGYGVAVEDSGYNNRVSFRGRLTVGGAAIDAGYGSGWERNGSNDSFTVNGHAIVEAGAGDDIRVEVLRWSSINPSTTVISNSSNFWMLKLSDSWDYIRLSNSGSGDDFQLTTAYQDVGFDVQDEYDTGTFTHSTSTANDDITLKSAGHYLVTYNVYMDVATSGDRGTINSRLTLNGTPVEQSYGYAFARFTSDTTQGFASNMVIIEAAADDVLNLEVVGSQTTGEPQGYVQNDLRAITIAKVPDTNVDYLRVHESGGGQTFGDSVSTDDIVIHDTEDEEDTDSFSHDTSTGRVTINQDGDYLFTFGARTDRDGTSTTRNTAGLRWFKNAVAQVPGTFITYIRGHDGGNADVEDGGASTAIIFDSLVSTDVVDIRETNYGDDGNDQDKFQADEQGITAVRLDDWFAVATAPSSTQTHLRWIYDNGSEAGADNRAAEDTAITGLNRFVPVHLRFQVSNEGTGDTSGEQYRLEHSLYADTCSSGTYTRLDSSTEWEIVDTKEYADGTASTDVAGRLSNANTTFVTGELKDTSDQTSTTTLTSSEYTEIEYTIRATENAAAGEKYCFRLTNAGTALDAYDVYAEATLASTASPTTIYRSVGNTTSSLEATPVTMEIATNTVTFSTDPTNGADNIGVGDVIVYSDGGTTYAAFIHGRTSSTVYTVANYVGDYPHAVSAGTAVDGIYRAFTGLSDWESQSVANVNSSITATNNVDDEVLYAGTGSQNLVFQNIAALVALYADADDTEAQSTAAGVYVSSWTTDANNYIKLYTPTSTSEVGTSQRHDGTAGTGYVFAPSESSPAANYALIGADVPNLTIEGVEFDGANVTNLGATLGCVFLYASDTSENTLSHSICHGVGQTSGSGFVGGVYLYAPADTLTAYIVNNIFYDMTVSGSATGGAVGIYQADAGITSYVYNNTVYSPSVSVGSGGAVGIQHGGGTMILKNNYVGGVSSSGGAELAYFGNFASGSTNNASFDDTCDDDADMANCVQNLSSYSSYFTSITGGSEDFHLKGDSNTLWGSYGADLDADSNYAVTDDIDGETRDATQPDIGADEYVAPPVAVLTQTHFRWIFNNEDEDEADSQYAEDATSTAVIKNDIQRLRFQVSNEGVADSSGETYRLEVSEANPGTCSAGTYERLSTDADWSVADSKEFSDGTATTNVSGRLTDENAAFVAGELKDTGDQASSITLTTTQFTELEYAVIAENAATNGATYCFRLTNAGTELDAYDEYAVAVVKSDPTTIFRSVGNTTSDLESSEVTVTISTTTATFSADPTGGTANIGVGDVIVYTEDSVVHAAFISGRTSSTQYSVANYTGGAPHKVTANAVDGIYRGFTSVSDWENQSTGDVNASITATNNVDDEVTYAGTGDKDLASQNILGRVALYKDATDTEAISLDSGWGTATTTYPYLYTPTSTSEVGTSQRHNGTAGTGYVNAPSTTATGFAIVNRVSANYVRIEGIESSGANLSNGEYVRWWHVDQDGGDTYFTHSLMYDLTNSTFDDSDSSAMIGFEHIGDGDVYLVNNIMYDFENVSAFATSFVNAIRHTAGSGDIYAYNNTIYDIYDSGSSSGSAEGFTTAGGGGRIYKNNYVGYVRSDAGTAAAYDAGAASGSTNNASFDDTCDDDADMANCVQNLDSYSSYFVSTTPGSIDLHILGDTSSIWGSSGADLDNDAIYPVVDDIDGEARDATTPDIGADEINGTPDVTQTHYRWRNDDGVESGAAGWYDGSWEYRVPLTVQSSEVDSTLTDFPIYVDMSDLPAGFFSNVASDGADIRITDSTGTTSLPLEVVEISTASSTGEMHFKASSVSSSSDTTFYIYYGNATATMPLATSTYGSENVWTQYVGVWHNNEDPSTDDIADSTGNNDGTPNVNMTSDDRIDGKLGGGYALHFDGDDYVDISADGGVLDIYGTGQTLTLCAWALVEVDDTPTSWPPIFAKGDTQYVLKLNNSGAWEFKTNGAYFTDGNPDLDTWYYLCGRNNGGTNNLFIDSVLQGNSSSASSIGNQSHAVWMGRDSQNTGRSPYWRGMIDEVRISTESLSADWIESEYTNQSSPNTFYTVGTAETETSEATWAADEDTAYTTFTPGTTKRLRFQVSNEGSASAGNLHFRLEVSEADPGSCSSASYARIDSSSTWSMTASSYMSDGDATEDVASGLTNENTTFVAGEYMITDDESSTSTLSTVQFTELEYVIKPTISAAGSDFCFRLTDSGDALDTYDSYAEATVLGQTLSFSISDYVIGFGDVLPSGARFATGDASGTSTAVVAHTISATTDASSGYTITVQGATLEDGALAIDAIGGTATSSNPGTEQFGMRLAASGGTGAVSSPYNSGSLYAFLADTADTVATLSSGDGVETVYSAYYLANVAALTEPGSYSTVLQYTITANF